MTVSIIIAVKTWQKNLEECVNKCLELNYPSFEIIIFPDETIEASVLPKTRIPIRVIPTGPVNPSVKRDMALEYAKSDIIAFIDDDAYPAKDWLNHAVRNFHDQTVAAVGGPAITAENDNIRQKASGAIYSSKIVSGKFIYRYLPTVKQEAADLPSCNLLIRRSVMFALGGFKTNFWPGEDTKLCLDITENLRLKIIYDPNVLVYHHRREVYLAHLKQIAAYALHRGYFVKKYPQTSLKLAYFLPTILVMGLVLGAILSIWFLPIRILYLSSLSLYLSMILFSSFKNLGLIPYVFSGIIMTHLTYGIFFVQGLISNKLKEE